MATSKLVLVPGRVNVSTTVPFCVMRTSYTRRFPPGSLGVSHTTLSDPASGVTWVICDGADEGEGEGGREGGKEGGREGGRREGKKGRN